MPSWPEVAQFATPSLGGLLALVVVLVLTGRLVPLSTLRREVRAEQSRTDDYKAAAEAANARADKTMDHLRELMPYARNVDVVMRALQAAHERGGEAR